MRLCIAAVWLVFPLLGRLTVAAVLAAPPPDEVTPGEAGGGREGGGGGDKVKDKDKASSVSELLARTHDQMGKPHLQLNVMVVGKTGLGKTSCINNLFETKVKEKQKETQQTQSQIFHHFVKDFNSSIVLDLTVVDTVGLGSSLHGASDYLPLQMQTISFLRQRVMMEQSNRRKRHEEDIRKFDLPTPQVHLILYFAPPHRLDGVDKAYIQKLAEWAPVTMLIAKADCMTDDERQQSKDLVVAAFDGEDKRGRRTFLTGGNTEGEPFAVLCRNRKYNRDIEWSVEQRSHSDFPTLKEFILEKFPFDAYVDIALRSDLYFNRLKREGKLQIPMVQSWSFWKQVTVLSPLAILTSIFHTHHAGGKLELWNDANAKAVFFTLFVSATSTYFYVMPGIEDLIMGADSFVYTREQRRSEAGVASSPPTGLWFDLHHWMSLPFFHISNGSGWFFAACVPVLGYGLVYFATLVSNLDLLAVVMMATAAALSALFAFY
jgi:GTP-binding protein EngB required for normal cell division